MAAKKKGGKYAEIMALLGKMPDEDKSQAQLVQDKAIKLKQGERHVIGSIPGLILNPCQDDLGLGGDGSILVPVGPALVDWVNLYIDMREHKKRVEEREKEFNLAFAAVCLMIEQGYTEAGITSLRNDDGRSVTSQPEPHITIQDPDACRDWCLSNGYGNLMSLAWGTLNSLGKEMLLEGHTCVIGMDECPKASVKADDNEIGTPAPQVSCIKGVKVFFRPKLVLR
jgi:hypothetical protein